MGRLKLFKKFWKFPSRCCTFSPNQEHPSPRMPTSYNLDSLNDLDLRVLCDQILALFQQAEEESGQENTSEARQRQREIWPKLSCIPFLKELFAETQPDSSVLDPYFLKGESEPSTLAYIILRDISASHRLAVGLLSLGSALENWGNIHINRDECLFEFKEMCYLAKLLCHVRYRMIQIQKLEEEEYPRIQIQKLEEEEYGGVDLLLQGSITCSVNANPNLTRYLSESLLELRRRTEKTCDNLHSMLLSGIFYGIRSSPLEGRPGMSYPFHAVDIEPEKEEIIKRLQWGSRRKYIAVILEGPAGIGKTTVADAVFTSLHVPKCNYIRYTWFDRFDQVKPQMRQDHWMRYGPESREDKDIEAERGKANVGEIEEEEDENEDGQEHEHPYEDSDGEGSKYGGRWVIDAQDKKRHDLLYWESQATADAAKQPHLCFFLYFDNPLWDLSDSLQYCLNALSAKWSRKVRIVVTTRNMEYAMKECKSVLTEDCIYTYRMKPNLKDDEEESLPVVVNDGINNFKEKYVKILRSSMGNDAWQTLELFGCFSTSNEERINADAAISKLISLCQCVPGWLLLVGKFIATQPCAMAAMQQLLSIVGTENDDGNEKWQKLAKLLLVRKENYVTEEENEPMDDALEMICFLFNGYPMKEIEDVFEEEDVLKRLRERGLLCVDNDEDWYAYVPYIIWQHVVATPKPRHCFIGSRPEAKAFDSQLQMDALQDKEKLIKILHVMNHHGEYGPPYGPPYSMDASNLRRVARTLLALYSKFAYDPPHHGDGDDVCMKKLVIYECWRHAPLALHNCPNITRLVLRSLHNDDIIRNRIPVDVRYLYLESFSKDIELSRWSMSNVAKLKNLRSLNLDLSESSMELTLAEELCMLSIRELSIRCHSLKELPHNFANMKYLHVLKLTSASLEQLPRDFGRLSSLTELAFRWCWSLTNVGRDVCTLQSLHTLHWTFTSNWDDAWLNDFMKMKSLRVLVLDDGLYGKLENNYYLRRPFLYHHPHHHVQLFYTNYFRDHSRKKRN